MFLVYTPTATTQVRAAWCHEQETTMISELQYIEREAREYGEAEYRADCLARGLCFECGGEGWLMGWDPASERECQECKGTGKDLRGCEWCGIAHHVQDCPAVRALLMAEPEPDDDHDEVPIIIQEGPPDRARKGAH